MEREQLLEDVRSQMPERRWQHTMGVMQTAVLLARRFGADEHKAELAAILHDVAKYWEIGKLERVIHERPRTEAFFFPEYVLKFDRQLLHAPVGAHVAETVYKVTDGEVLDAIMYHTSGREFMSLVEKVVCLADYMEPGRDFPGVDRIRELAETDLNRALVAGFDTTISHLLQKGRMVFPLTVIARNSLIEEG